MVCEIVVHVPRDCYTLLCLPGLQCSERIEAQHKSECRQRIGILVWQLSNLHSRFCQSSHSCTQAIGPCLWLWMRAQHNRDLRYVPSTSCIPHHLSYLHPHTALQATLGRSPGAFGSTARRKKETPSLQATLRVGAVDDGTNPFSLPSDNDLFRTREDTDADAKQVRADSPPSSLLVSLSAVIVLSLFFLSFFVDVCFVVLITCSHNVCTFVCMQRKQTLRSLGVYERALATQRLPAKALLKDIEDEEQAEAGKIERKGEKDREIESER